MRYFKRLKSHPGVPVAGFLTAVFPLAGLANKNGWQDGVIAGLVAAAVVWLIVLWTARTQPLPEDRP
jgi:fucose permease